MQNVRPWIYSRPWSLILFKPPCLSLELCSHLSGCNFSFADFSSFLAYPNPNTFIHVKCYDLKIWLFEYNDSNVMIQNWRSADVFSGYKNGTLKWVAGNNKITDDVCGALRRLVRFVQFKKHEKHLGGVLHLELK